MRFRVCSFMLTATILFGATAQADGNYKCDVPKAEMRPKMELQNKLQTEGWKIRMIHVENGCYEVYGFDADKKRVEAFFDPKTFARLDIAH